MRNFIVGSDGGFTYLQDIVLPGNTSVPGSWTPIPNRGWMVQRILAAQIRIFHPDFNYFVELNTHAGWDVINQGVPQLQVVSCDAEGITVAVFDLNENIWIYDIPIHLCYF